MDSAQNSSPLVAKEIHGFDTLADLDIGRLLNEAQHRWFRPNEVHAMLTNYSHFKIQPQPVDKPKSGTVLLFDRKVLRNFRKDGYNWRKKKDGKNVQEAHEKLKIGNEERIHVYYARSDEDPNFYRRSYWLLDRNMERIVLVHYRHTSEEAVSPQPSLPAECLDPVPHNNMTNYSSPAMPVNSTGCSAHSNLSGSAVFSEEINSGEVPTSYPGSGLYPVNQHAQGEIISVNDFDLDNLEEPVVYSDLDSHTEGYIPSLGQQMQYDLLNCPQNGCFLQSPGMSSSEHSSDLLCNNGINGTTQRSNGSFHTAEGYSGSSSLFNNVNPSSKVTDLKSVGSGEMSRLIADAVLTSQDSFGRWNNMINESLGSLDSLPFDSPTTSGDKQGAFRMTDHLSTQAPIFNIVELSPEWAYSTLETKVIVIGFFSESYKHLSGSKIYFVFGKTCIAAEMIQDGVYRCITSPQMPGLVNFFLTLDGFTPISEVLSFEHRPIPSLQSNGRLNALEDGNNKLKKILNQAQIRLAHLLFSTTDTMSILSNKIQPKFLKEAKRYESLTSPLVEKDWNRLLKVSGDNEISDVEALFELLLENKLQEWILHKVAGGYNKTPRDSQGQGVIHLCVILDYVWAVRLFSMSGLSLDFRDAFGWTALHWAAYYGREKMVAALLYAGANPSLVTDPTTERPGGCTASDLASKGGYEGLAAYLAEKALTAHVQAMASSGNITSPIPPTSNIVVNSQCSENLSEQEICLKESLAAYRNAAEAADRIQSAFRERALKQQTRAVQLANPIVEAKQIVSALKIQHAFRNYNRRRLLKAAAQIQSHFRTWQARKNFINMRRQAIKIQAAFRGHQVRKQYRKITWSVGVLEKAILRWRLKRKGLRGLQTEATQEMEVDKEQEENVAEEDFFRIGREQAEERIRSSVVKVQSMFRSYQAQQEYRRMKLAHEAAKHEFDMDGAVGGPRAR